MECGVFDGKHLLTTLAGFESFMSNPNDHNSNLRYANTVLKLNGTDLYAIAGQEGILSAIKAGGSKIYEMVVNFLKAIKNFFFGSKGVKQDRDIKRMAAETEQIKKDITNHVKVAFSKTHVNKKMDEMVRRATKTLNNANKVLNKEALRIHFRRSSDVTERLPKGISSVIYEANEFQAGIKGDYAAYLAEIDRAIDVIVLTAKLNNDEDMTETNFSQSQLVDTADCGDKVAEKILDMFQKCKTVLGKATTDLEGANKRLKEIEDGRAGESVRDTPVRIAVHMLVQIESYLTGLMRRAIITMTDIFKRLKGMLTALYLEDKDIRAFAEKYDIASYQEALAVPAQL